MRLALAFALVAGCGFDHGVFTGGRDAAPGDALPVDAAIMIDASNATPDAPPDAPPAVVDTDNDTVLDAMDNCPAAANTDQRDHDDDDKGDVCDFCPHLASATDPDADGDLVGDACDPRVNTPGDVRVLWEGFYDASSIANWTSAGNGTWAVANGVLTQSSTTTSTTNRTLSPPITVARAAVTSQVRAIAFGSPTQPFDTPHASVSAGVAQDHSYWCSLVDDGNDDVVYASTQNGGGWNFPGTGWPGTWAPQSVVTLQLRLSGSNNVCTVSQGTTTSTTMGNIGEPGGAVQVVTRTASASFDYLFVVSIGM